jgi:hypothetical protein
MREHGGDAYAEPSGAFLVIVSVLAVIGTALVALMLLWAQVG